MAAQHRQEYLQRNSLFPEKLHPKSSVQHVIGVLSGKGGVGKSLVTAMLAVGMQRRGHRTAVLDADITGPSIPAVFGIRQRTHSRDRGLMPAKSSSGIGIMSMNLLLDAVDNPVIWRGPLVSGVIKQFWSDVLWQDIDYMFVDLPPGTGDAPLTVFQSMPLDGAIIVTSPQSIVNMIVSKAVHMAEKMSIPVLGIVENMAYFHCPQCGSIHRIFGSSHVEETAARHHIAQTARLPLESAIAELCDRGRADELDEKQLQPLEQLLMSLEGLE